MKESGGLKQIINGCVLFQAEMATMSDWNGNLLDEW